ncbi:MAG: carboxylating nicotinate-nucleotide diphosphorylase [Xanthomonadales bacterium]|nr:carboxylating nicotinate-nucleotide diphosphorylase [Xanthomonadales bacterium]ODU91648.1 MAG: nicotinate-nucleotide diphosphorylase (carboxylating) [Rhodanobacter sp. SCN 66-43]OJY86591.1 MAG: nicotinate-nucleotide diphosphorylase (carboxylating) [Xanthomonadales bacterium 66-474]
MSGAGSRPTPPPPETIRADVARTLAEDIGTGDVTAALIAPDARASAHIVSREDAVLAGAPWAEECFRQLDPDVRIDWRHHDGDRIAADSVLCGIEGNARALVAGERNALNFLQTLSGTATTTRRYVDVVAGTRAKILDTRKTIPGLRLAQKYAVRCGGGHNHRIGLYDAILVKENHVAAAGGIAQAIHAARAASPGVFLDCEVESLDELSDAIAAGADRVLLDEFSDAMLRDAVALAAGRVPLEVSGSVNLERVRAIAETGVDCVSIGALTKHVRAVDLSMRFDEN